jgi:hypothetical protein
MRSGFFLELSNHLAIDPFLRRDGCYVRRQDRESERTDD